MIPLAASQESLKERIGLDPIFLAVLTVYSDKPAGTVDTVYYWTRSSSAVLYDWGGGGVKLFEPLVLEADFGGEDPGVGALIDRVPTGAPADRLGYSIVLANESVTDEDDPIWATLRAENLHGADLVVAELLVNPSLRLGGGAAQWDLRSLAGTEHTIRFRGELVKVDPVGETIPLRFTQVEPDMPWPTLLNRETNHPEDFGSRMPVCVGHAKNIPLSRIEVGHVSTFTAAMDRTATGYRSVTDVTGFPVSGDFSVWVDGEEMLCDVADHEAGSINVVTRGVGGTTAVEHQAGSTVIELLDEVVLGAVGSDITALQVFSPVTNEWTRVDTPYLVTPNDSQAIPGVDGIVTARLTKENQRALRASFNVAAQVTVQPDFEGETLGTVGVTATARFNPTTIADIPDNSARGNMNETLTPPEWSYNTGVRERMEWTFITGDLSGLGSKEVKSWQMYLDAECISTSFDGTTATITNDGIPGLGSASAVANLPEGDRDVVKSGNRDPDGSTLSDLVGKKLIVKSNVTGTSGFPASASQEIHEVAIEAEYYTTSPDASGADIALARITDTEIVAASVGFAALFRADVEGSVVPGQFVDDYGFDQGSTWSTDGLTHVDDTTEQTFSLPAAVQVHACDALDNWAARNGASIALNTTDENEGTGCIEVTADTQNDAIRQPNFSASTYGAVVDASADLFAFDLFVVNDAATRLDHIDVTLASDTTPTVYKGWRLLDLDPDFVMNEWRTIIWDPASNNHYRGSGTIDVASLDLFQVTANIDNLGGGTADCTFRIDNVRLLSISGVAQLNSTTGTVDITSSGDAYTIVATGTNLAALDYLTVSFADEVETGTTQADARREFTIGSGQLTEATSVEITPSMEDVGGPTIVDVETIRVEMVRDTGSDASPEVSLDVLRTSTATNTNYSLAVGTLIENPADVDRWLVADFAGMGHAAIGTSNATARTSFEGGFGIEPIAMAGNLTGLGFTLAEVRGRMLYESRAQGWISERASASQYEITTTGALLVYAAATETWGADSYTSLTEEMPDLAGLFTTSRVFFAFDATEESANERAFHDVSVADVDQNDTFLSSGFLAAAETAIGRRLAGPTSLLMHQTLASVNSFHVFHAVYGASNTLAVFRLDGVPHWVLFDLEPGDIGTLTTPRGSTHKCLVLSVQRPIGGVSGSMVLAEVI